MIRDFSELEKEEFYVKCLQGMNEAGQKGDPYRIQYAMMEMFKRIYDMGYTAGHHEANGDKILNSIAENTDPQ